MDEQNDVKNKAFDIGYRTMVSVMPQGIDEFAKWLTTGVGATAALMVASADKLLPVLGVSGFKWSFYFLLTSVALGVISRLLASVVTVAMQVLVRMESELPGVEGDALRVSFLADLPDPEMEAQVREEFLAPMPPHVRFMTRWLSRRRKRPQRLSLLGRVLVKSATLQATTAILALIFAVIGMAFAVAALDFNVDVPRVAGSLMPALN
ncbi:hypothetical protein [Luteibacter yeojuensis]|nr:hypothetical protein [Luteibacter yeojuensis]